MRRAIGGLAIALVCGAGTVAAQEMPEYPDPTRFDKAIAAFEAADAEALPPKGAVVCVGSSSMRGWHRRIAEDLAPLTVVPRGFGGSTMYDVLHHLDRVVLAYRPRAVLLYEGDNDVAAGISPARIRATFDSLTTRVHAVLPRARIYVISVKPSIRRWQMWPQMEEANRLLRKGCDQDERLTFIDVATPMLGEDGTPRPELFVDDQLHMTDAGYDIWAAAVGPVLRAREEAFEESEEP